MRTSLVWALALSVVMTAGACRTVDDKETDDTDTDDTVDTVVDPDTDSDTVPDTDDTEVIDTDDTDTDDTEVVDTDTDDTEVVDTDTDDTEVVDTDTDDTDTDDTEVVDTDTDDTADTLVVDTDTDDTDVVDTELLPTADTGETGDTEVVDTEVIDTEIAGPTGDTADTDIIDTFDDTFYLRPTADTYDTDNPVATADTYWDDDSGVAGNLAFRGTVRDFDPASGPVASATVALRVSQAPLQISQTDVSGRFLFRPPVASQGELTVLKTGYFNTSYFPRFGNTDLDLGLYMLTNAQVSALASAASVTPQGSAGHVLMVAVDALGAPVDGASFNVVSPSGQTPIYFDNTMAITAGSATAVDGAGVVFNLPSGTFSARATHPSRSCASLVAWPGSVAREGVVRVYPSQISVAVYRCQ